MHSGLAVGRADRVGHDHDRGEAAVRGGPGVHQLGELAAVQPVAGAAGLAADQDQHGQQRRGAVR